MGWDGIGNAAIRTEPVEFTYNYFIYGGGGIVELKFDPPQPRNKIIILFFINGEEISEIKCRI